MSSIAWPRSWAAEPHGPPAWAAAAVLAVTYLVVVPGGGDLAAQAYRAHLGPVLWDNGWYGGHQMVGYSVLYPPLAAVAGGRVVGAVAAVAAAWLFERLALERWGERARIGTLWFAVGTAANLVSGRMTFALGLALGLGAVLAATRGEPRRAVALAVLTGLASPVAAVFLGIAAAAWWLADRRPAAVALGAAAVVPSAALAVVFPEGGRFPFVASSFWPAVLALAGVLLVVPRRERVLRIGLALMLAATVASFLVANPLGGNVIRLGTIAAGPLVACLLWPRRRLVLAAMAGPLLVWQWVAPVTDVRRAAGDPAMERAFYATLLIQLDRRAAAEGPFRVEIPFTANHWEARWVATRHPLARGWLRQVDTVRNPLFYDERPLTAERYRRWLRDGAVRYVALPDAPLDGSALAEARLLRAGVPGLREVWRDRRWRLFAFAGARPLAAGAARATRLDAEAVTLAATRPGGVDVRVRFNPYWRLEGGRGCVARGPGGWTRVRVRAAGTVRLRPAFTPARIGATGQRCSP